MKKKYDLNLIMGYFLLSIGLVSISYAIIAIIIGVFFSYLGIITYFRDILFEIIFVLIMPNISNSAIISDTLLCVRGLSPIFEDISL